jgi:serine/threonine protein kinase
MTSSDTPSPKLADHDVSSRHSLQSLDFARRKGGDDLSTDDEQSFMDETVGTKKSAADVLENSLQSLSLQNGGGKAKADPTLSPPPSVDQHKRKLGLDFLKVLETKNHKKGGGSVVSQLSLLVNDSASGAHFDDVYDMGDVLGEGGFAFVYRCTHKKNGHNYAVKEIITTDNQISAAESVRGEINALKLLREGPYVVRLLDVFYEPDRTMVVQEIMKGGDLLDKLTEIEVYDPDDARKVSRTLLEALDYCHKKRICHRDIKPENILLVKDDDLTHIKIADFGCAKKITGPKCLKTLCGSPQYVAPELLTHEDGYNELCDMWSCGVVIYVLLGGYAPFDAPECELAELITAGNYEFHEEYWDEIPGAAKDLIVHLLQVDPADRYNPAEALECRWLRRKDKDIVASSLHESTSSFGAWLERRNSARSLLD